MSTYTPDYWRQAGFFDPVTFDKNIHVIGAGALGSHFVDTVCCMGCSKITVYDFDRVEPHNIPNQVFKLSQIGQSKVEALKLHVKEKSGIDIVAIDKKIEGKCEFDGIVVLAVDSMAARKDIFDTNVRQNKKVYRCIDMRMGIDSGLILFLDPLNKNHLKRWGQECYTDAQAGESPCNLRAIVTTAKYTVALAAHRMIREIQQTETFPRFNMASYDMYGGLKHYTW